LDLDLVGCFGVVDVVGVVGVVAVSAFDEYMSKVLDML
jgi:hypothetical protein